MIYLIEKLIVEHVIVLPIVLSPGEIAWVESYFLPEMISSIIDVLGMGCRAGFNHLFDCGKYVLGFIEQLLLDSCAEENEDT